MRRSIVALLMLVALFGTAAGRTARAEVSQTFLQAAVLAPEDLQPGYAIMAEGPVETAYPTLSRELACDCPGTKLTVMLFDRRGTTIDDLADLNALADVPIESNAYTYIDEMEELPSGLFIRATFSTGATRVAYAWERGDVLAVVTVVSPGDAGPEARAAALRQDGKLQRVAERP